MAALARLPGAAARPDAAGPDSPPPAPRRPRTSWQRSIVSLVSWRGGSNSGTRPTISQWVPLGPSPAQGRCEKASRRSGRRLDQGGGWMAAAAERRQRQQRARTSQGSGSGSRFRQPGAGALPRAARLLTGAVAGGLGDAQAAEAAVGIPAGRQHRRGGWEGREDERVLGRVDGPRPAARTGAPAGRPGGPARRQAGRQAPRGPASARPRPRRPRAHSVIFLVQSSSISARLCALRTTTCGGAGARGARRRARRARPAARRRGAAPRRAPRQGPDLSQPRAQPGAEPGPTCGAPFMMRVISPVLLSCGQVGGWVGGWAGGCTAGGRDPLAPWAAPLRARRDAAGTPCGALAQPSHPTSHPDEQRPWRTWRYG